MFTIFLILGFSNFLAVTAADKKRYKFENSQIKVRLTPQYPQQIAAFYEGRGFSKQMINRLKQQCFLTTGVLNKSKDIIWHDITKWVFTDKSGVIIPFNKQYWKK